MPDENGNKPATQADIKVLAQDIKKLNQKLDQKFGYLVLELIKTREEIALKVNSSVMDEKLNHLVTVLDSMNAKFIDQTRTILVYDQILGEHDAKLRNHNQRLTTLESK